MSFNFLNFIETRNLLYQRTKPYRAYIKHQPFVHIIESEKDHVYQSFEIFYHKPFTVKRCYD